jgi:hypothetical protein
MRVDGPPKSGALSRNTTPPMAKRARLRDGPPLNRDGRVRLRTSSIKMKPAIGTKRSLKEKIGQRQTSRAEYSGPF